MKNDDDEESKYSAVIRPGNNSSSNTIVSNMNTTTVNRPPSRGEKFKVNTPTRKLSRNFEASAVIPLQASTSMSKPIESINTAMRFPAAQPSKSEFPNKPFIKFVDGEKKKIQHQTQVLERQKTLKTLNEFKKFSEGFKLKTPMPKDLADIIKPDSKENLVLNSNTNTPTNQVKPVKNVSAKNNITQKPTAKHVTNIPEPTVSQTTTVKPNALNSNTTESQNPVAAVTPHTFNASAAEFTFNPSAGEFNPASGMAQGMIPMHAFHDEQQQQAYNAGYAYYPQFGGYQQLPQYYSGVSFMFNLIVYATTRILPTQSRKTWLPDDSWSSSNGHVSATNDASANVRDSLWNARRRK
jgi:hypothetical protein